jgi:endo-1,4-beta-D-glucanase Y
MRATLAAERDHVEILQKLWEWAKNNLTTEELKINCYLEQTIRGGPSCK